MNLLIRNLGPIVFWAGVNGLIYQLFGSVGLCVSMVITGLINKP